MKSFQVVTEMYKEYLAGPSMNQMDMQDGADPAARESNEAMHKTTHSSICRTE